jgi:hypothetical protein
LVLHTALAGEGVQNWIPDVLIDGKVRVFHAQRAKQILVVQLFNGSPCGALYGLTQDDIVSVGVLLVGARRKVHFAVPD